MKSPWNDSHQWKGVTESHQSLKSKIPKFWIFGSGLVKGVRCVLRSQLTPLKQPFLSWASVWPKIWSKRWPKTGPKTQQRSKLGLKEDPNLAQIWPKLFLRLVWGFSSRTIYFSSFAIPVWRAKYEPIFWFFQKWKFPGYQIFFKLHPQVETKPTVFWNTTPIKKNIVKNWQNYKFSLIHW